MNIRKKEKAIFKFKKSNYTNLSLRDLWGFLGGENRSKIIWLSTGLGSFFIVGYYLSLDIGFTPDINLGQASILLIQACILGFILVSISTCILFAPILAYRLCGINIDEIPKEHLKILQKHIFFRAFYVQMFSSASYLTVELYAKNSIPQYSYIVPLIGSISFILASRCKRICYPGKVENKKAFWLTNTAIFTLTLCPVLIIAALYYSSGLNEDSKIVITLMAWFILISYSAVLSLLRKDQILPGITIALSLAVFVLHVFEASSLPFKTIAYKIGIAEQQSVTLIFPEKTCKQLKNSFMDELIQLKCDGEKSGVLNDVMLLNSFGSRWLMRIEKNIDKEKDKPVFKQTIVFDGNEVMIVKQNKTRNNN